MKNSEEKDGLINLPARQSVDQTVETLIGLLKSKNVTIFALIDHSGEAAKVDLKMPPTKLVIFGTPKAGTLLMQAKPKVAIDLPSKILVWQDANSKGWVTYNSLDYLKERHGLSDELMKNIAALEVLAAKAAE